MKPVVIAAELVRASLENFVLRPRAGKDNGKVLRQTQIDALDSILQRAAKPDSQGYYVFALSRK